MDYGFESVEESQMQFLTDSDKSTVVINVSGLRFETHVFTLERFPNTLLGCFERRSDYYNSVREEYFFDRHRSSFESILYFYQSGGNLRRPANVPNDIFEQEIQFYDLGKDVLDNFHKFDCDEEDEDDEILPANTFQRNLWKLFEKPESSLIARLVACFSMIVIWVSIISFVLETIPELQHYKLIHNKEIASLLPTITEDHWSLYHPFFIIESICNIWFTFELVIRFVCCPNKCKFMKTKTNLIDITAISPYILLIIVMSTNPNAFNSISLIRGLRLIRLFRVLKLFRHSTGLRVLGRTLRASYQELGFLCLLILLCSTIYASGVFFAESGLSDSDFKSIPDALWWAVITMTTVGYGDKVPKTVWSKGIGGLCAITGVLALSLPMPVIVNTFDFYYTRERERRDKHVYVPVGNCSPVRSILRNNSILSEHQQSRHSISKFDNKYF